MKRLSVESALADEKGQLAQDGRADVGRHARLTGDDVHREAGVLNLRILDRHHRVKIVRRDKALTEAKTHLANIKVNVTLRRGEALTAPKRAELRDRDGVSEEHLASEEGADSVPNLLGLCEGEDGGAADAAEACR